MDILENETTYEFNTSIGFENVVSPLNYNTINIDSIKKWLKNPMYYNQEIRSASRVLYNKNGIYANVVDYMVSLPTLDRVVYGRNRKNRDYQTNKDKFISSLDSLKDKILIRDNLRKLSIDAVAFYYFQYDENASFDNFMSDYDRSQTEINKYVNCNLFPLPTDYCEIVGLKNSSYVVAFDLSYFDNFTGKGKSKKLMKYPKEIREGYKQFRKSPNNQWIVLDNDKTVATKARSNIDEKWGRPLGLASFIDILYDEYYTDTKRKILDDVNSTIVYQTFPEGKEKGKSSLTQKQQKEQHDNIKQALFSRSNVKGVNFFSVASGTKLEKMDTDVEFLKVNAEDELIKRITTSLGFASSLLNADSGTSSSQKANLDLITAEIMSWIEQIKSELNKVINKNIIKNNSNYIEVDYLPITHANRKEMVRHMKDLFLNAGGSVQAWISSTGFNPETYLALMDEERSLNFDEKYPPHKTSYTTSGKDESTEAKKPINNDSDNPNTIKNKNTGANPIE
ncbi:hypothetical protein [Paraliobacillus ryukyuensis]|uniref:hypothetical protein n=1 Tax=Paraliobacillus ryukyuensis TaxID=200904 RepID=UPI0009A6B380|nr:hypothetical protein [Paraliobacillus ryukyuensis]